MDCKKSSRITCHWITGDFELKEAMLTIHHVKYPHTGENIKDILNQIIEEWNLKGSVFCIVTDNASNMKKAGRLLNPIHRLPCTAHTLQLVIGKGLLPAQVLIARAKRLINFFMSPKQSERLEVAQHALCEDENSIIRDTANYLHAIADVETRWNSSFLAWQRLLRIRPFIIMVQSTLAVTQNPDIQLKKDFARLNKIMLKDDEFDAIEALVEILGQFAVATEWLGGSKYSTSGFMYPTIQIIMKNLKPTNTSEINIDFNDTETAFDDIISEDGDEELFEETTSNSQKKKKININIPQNTNCLVDKIKNALYIAMKQYYIIPSDEMILSAILDPRCKKLAFATHEQRIDAENKLQILYNELLQEVESDSITPKDPTTIQPNLKPDSPIQKYKDMMRHGIQAQRKSVIQDEVKEYLTIDEIDIENDPFKWWCVNKEHFPILAKLARKYLGIPATSTPSERLFSHAGLVMTNKRTQLSSSTFEKILFLKRNIYDNNIISS